MNAIKQIPTEAECGNIDRCIAPLCPYDEDAHKRIWYPGEPICIKRQVPRWVRIQRKVAKRAKTPGLYFILSDLEAMQVVVRPTGHDPNYSIRSTA